MIVDCPNCNQRHVILERAGETTARCECGHEFALAISAIESGVLKCGNCGANPPSDRGHCPYCDARLTTLRCPRCVACAIEGDQHCRACGHRLDAPVATASRPSSDVLHCPRCDDELKAVMAGDATVDECSRCGGVWLAHGVFEFVLKQKFIDATLKSLRSVVPAKISYGREAPESDERFYVHCPECKTMMQRRQFARSSGVVVDICSAHGVWFDYDELPRIVAFVRDGGVEAATQKLYEQRVAELENIRKKPLDGTAVAQRTPGSMGAVDVLATILNLLR